MATKSKEEKRLGQKVKESLDGRTQRWLSQKIGMSEDKLSNKIKGLTDFTTEEIAKINEVLQTNY